MKKFLLADKTQRFLNIALGMYIIIAMIVFFCASSGRTFDSVLWYPISALLSVIGFLAYNIWVSMALNPSTIEKP